MEYSNTMKCRHLMAMLLCGMFCAACSESDDPLTEGAPSGGVVTIDQTSYTSGEPEGSTETGFDEADLLDSYTFDRIVHIDFGESVTIANPYAESGVSVTVEGHDVTINSTIGRVEYLLSGATADGTVKIYSENRLKLTLNGVSINNNNGPAINIQSGSRIFVALADNTTSSLSDGATYAAATNGEDQKAAFFSEGQLIFTGTGTLNVQGHYRHGICSDDYIRVLSGTINITGAATDGIHVNDYFVADGGTFNIVANSDGIEVEEGFIIVNDGDFTINVADDGIAASYEESDTGIDPYVVINGGAIVINTTGGEGIESKSHLTINDGNIKAMTADDALNAGTAIYINGGTVYTYSSGNDAIDSNGTITITGGKVIAIGAGGAEGGFDCDANTFKVTGGLILGTGGRTSSPTASVSALQSLIMGGSTANQIIHIEDAAGNEVLTFMPPNTFGTMLYASTKMQADTPYYIYTGGSVANGSDWYGLYTSGDYTRGTVAANFTTSNKVTQLGGSVSRN